MADQFYIRVRGRVLGPYDQERLQSLARRGQFSKMHELSTDGISWVRASSHAELFTAEIVEPPPAIPQSAAGRGAAQPGTQSEPAAQELWYYAKDGVEGGPVDFAGLQLLANMGRVGPDDLICKPGMREWVPARSVRGLDFSGAPQADHGLGGTRSPSMAQSEAALPESVCKAGSDSRPWVLFIAVMGFIYAGLLVVGGMFGLIAAASEHIAELVVFGLTSVIVGAVTIIGAALLVRYANYLGGLRYARQFVVLERALEALKTFWVFASIVLIVVLAFIVMTVVWATAVGATLAGWVRP
jgi:hypothetical protein